MIHQPNVKVSLGQPSQLLLDYSGFGIPVKLTVARLLLVCTTQTTLHAVSFSPNSSGKLVAEENELSKSS